MLKRIPDDVLALPVSGVNLTPGRLRDQLGDSLHLLVFLRHFGCVFCRETIADLRDISAANPDFPGVLFLFQGSPTEGRAFLRRHWREARAISDPELRLYEAFGIRRGGVLQMFGPGVWAGKRRANEKGHRNGERSGDIWRMPGVFLARGDEILWSHAYRHAGDHPDFASVGELAQGA